MTRMRKMKPYFRQMKWVAKNDPSFWATQEYTSTSSFHSFKVVRTRRKLRTSDVQCAATSAVRNGGKLGTRLVDHGVNGLRMVRILFFLTESTPGRGTVRQERTCPVDVRRLTSTIPKPFRLLPLESI